MYSLAEFTLINTIWVGPGHGQLVVKVMDIICFILSTGNDVRVVNATISSRNRSLGHGGGTGGLCGGPACASGGLVFLFFATSTRDIGEIETL